MLTTRTSGSFARSETAYGSQQANRLNGWPCRVLAADLTTTHYLFYPGLHKHLSQSSVNGGDQKHDWPAMICRLQTRRRTSDGDLLSRRKRVCRLQLTCSWYTLACWKSGHSCRRRRPHAPSRPGHGTIAMVSGGLGEQSRSCLRTQ